MSYNIAFRAVAETRVPIIHPNNSLYIITPPKHNQPDTGDLHPNDVAEPLFANPAIMAVTAEYAPRPAVARLASVMTAYQTLSQSMGYTVKVKVNAVVSLNLSNSKVAERGRKLTSALPPTPVPPRIDPVRERHLLARVIHPIALCRVHLHLISKSKERREGVRELEDTDR